MLSSAEVGNLLRALDSVRITSEQEIGPCAKRFRKIVSDPLEFRIAPWPDVASIAPMRDDQGNNLATQIFGWAPSESEWWTNRRLALDSPIPRLCRYEAMPFWYNRSGLFPKDRFSTNADISTEMLAKYAILPAAIIIPVHQPLGQVGAVAFADIDPETDDLSAKFEKYAALLWYFSMTFISSYNDVIRKWPLLPRDITLSSREAECLRWAALGKTDDEIAEIVNLSRSTIRYHITNMSQKFGAISRSQMILNALRLGFVAGI